MITEKNNICSNLSCDIEANITLFLGENMSFFNNYLKFTVLAFAICLLSTISIANSQENNHQIFLPLIYTPPGSTTLVSVSSEGVSGNSGSYAPEISADGRYVVFESSSTNLDPNSSGDPNLDRYIFLHDRQTGKTKMVSVSSDGVPSNGPSVYPSISADGRYIVFASSGTNLVPNKTTAPLNIFLHDQQTGKTTLISKSSEGVGGNSISKYPTISANGQYIAYFSNASNLADGADGDDILLHDRNSGKTIMITPKEIVKGKSFTRWYPSISANGKYVVYSQTTLDHDTDIRTVDAILYDVEQNKTTILPAPPGYRGALPTISANGKYVAFFSIISATSQQELSLLNLETGEITIIVKKSRFNMAGISYSISDDGRFVSFSSEDATLVPNDTNNQADTFVYDHLLKKIERVSVSSDKTQANNASYFGSLSGDGRFVTFSSYASNLVSQDLSEYEHIFVFDRERK